MCALRGNVFPAPLVGGSGHDYEQNLSVYSLITFLERRARWYGCYTLNPRQVHHLIVHLQCVSGRPEKSSPICLQSLNSQLSSGTLMVHKWSKGLSLNLNHAIS